MFRLREHSIKWANLVMMSHSEDIVKLIIDLKHIYFRGSLKIIVDVLYMTREILYKSVYTVP